MEAYVFAEQADLFLNGYPGTEAWFLLSEKEKDGLLFKASIAIDGAGTYKGKQQGDMAFPRDMDEAVPERVVVAVILEALAYTDLALLRRFELISQGVSGVKIGSSSESFNRVLLSKRLVSDAAYKLIEPLLVKGSVSIW